VSKTIIVETWRQPIGIVVTQSLDADITTTKVETIIAPSMDVVKKGVLIGSIAKLGSGLGDGSGGVLARRKLNESTTLPIATTRVVRTPQMMFTNPIMITHVNRTTNQPLMSSMAVGGCISANVANPKGGYGEPYVVTAPIIDYKGGHYVKPNKVALKYPNFKKDVDPDAHVGVFNFVIKKNVETFEKYIINAFSYSLRDTTSNWCHNYMSEFSDYISLELT
jgi:hypothetical protein